MLRLPILCLFAVPVVAIATADDIVLRKEKPRKMLVLNNGQVYEGQMISRAEGYDVILPAGQIFISKNNIRFVATSMQDAYEKMVASLPHKTPAVHVQMARWCLSNKLHGHARRELLDALHLDPDHSTARKMLESLARQERRAQQAGQTDVQTKLTLQRSGMTDRRSLGGLPPEVARTFTVSIQTLVSNRCGNAGCHGGDRSEFKFTHVRRSSTVVTAEQNLAALLKQIDIESPDDSPLLTYAQTIHGGARSPLFAGRSGRTHLKILKDWVHDVSEEMNPDAARRDSPSEVVQVSAETEEPSADESGYKMRARSKSKTDREFDELARKAARQDPFDPMIFNRRYHGTTRRPR